MLIKDDFSGWVEGRALNAANLRQVAKFLWEDVICKYKIFGQLTVDGNPENKDVVKQLAVDYGIKRVVISAYNSKANGMIERGYSPIVNAFAKMTDGGKGNQVQNFHAVLWADRTTVRKSTGYTPFYFNVGSEPILPIELDIFTWRIFPWGSVQTTADFLVLRIRQFQCRDEDIEEARLHLQRMREKGKDLWDGDYQMRPTTIEAGYMVLLHDTQRQKDVFSNRKFRYRWLGPFRVFKAIHEKGIYLLEKLNGIPCRGTFAGNRLKPFYPRIQIEYTHVQGTNTFLQGDEGDENEEDIEDREN